MTLRAMANGLALMLSLALLGFLFEASDLGHGINAAWIDANVRDHGVPGALLFLMMSGALTALGLPRQIIAFLGGYAFDVGLGTLLAVLGTGLGCVLSFGYARLAGRGLLRERLGERVARFDCIVCKHAFSTTMLIRLLPIGNNLLTNLAAGVSSIRPAPFFLGTLVGYLPQTLAFALVGSGMQIAPVLKLGLGAALFLASGALGIWLYRNIRASDACSPLDSNTPRDATAPKP
jgi:uncharacterized membrane protein YdjX (TVP38/TMEM64 family)